MEKPQIAFAGCLLNRLSWRFVREWTRAINVLDAEDYWTTTTKPIPPKPDVIILAALSLSEKWTDDYDRSTHHWVRLTENRHTRRELAVTQECILQDAGIDYSLHQISREEVEQMMAHMYALDAPVLELSELGVLAPHASPARF